MAAICVAACFEIFEFSWFYNSEWSRSPELCSHLTLPVPDESHAHLPIAASPVLFSTLGRIGQNCCMCCDQHCRCRCCDDQGELPEEEQPGRRRREQEEEQRRQQAKGSGGTVRAAEDGDEGLPRYQEQQQQPAPMPEMRAA